MDEDPANAVQIANVGSWAELSGSCRTSDEHGDNSIPAKEGGALSPALTLRVRE